MMIKRKNKLLALALLLGMLLSLLPAAALAAENGTRWEMVAPGDVAEGDIVAITVSKDGTTWILPNEATEQAPAAAEASFSEDGTLCADEAVFGWTIKAAEGGFSIGSANGFLDPGTEEKGLTTNGTETVWTVEGGLLKAAEAQRYLAVSTAGWLASPSIDEAMAGGTLAFWKLIKDDPDEHITMDDPAGEGETTPDTAPFLPTDSLQTDDKVVIFNPKENKIAAAKEYTDESNKTELETLDVTLSEDGKLNVPEDAAILTVSVNENGQFSFVTEDGKYLFADGSNLKFADEAGDYTLFLTEDPDDTELNGKFIKSVNAKTEEKPLYIACKGGHITTAEMDTEQKDSFVFRFFKEEPPAEPTTVPIADALAGETGAAFTVKGVVTMVDGMNVFLQDETGGICLLFDAAPTDISLGDTLIASGVRATYNNELPELSGASCQKSSGLTLAAKETTIGALKDADICTYVKLTDLEVTGIDDKNGTSNNPDISLKDAEGNTILLYKAALNKTTEGVWRVKVGDRIDIECAVGINTDLQLRNTLDSEITVKSSEPVKPATPTATPAPGEVEKGTVVTFVCETEGAAISWSTDGGETWNDGSSCTVNADVTIQVKAVLNGVESEVASFSYTVKAEPVKPATPTATPAPGEVAKGTVVTFSCATEGAAISWSTDGGKTWSDGSSCTVNADVTVQVKAVLNGVESEIASFSYTVKADTPTAEYRVVVTDNAVVPETLKSKYATVAAMKTAMLTTAKRSIGVETVKGDKLYELTVEYNDGSGWKPVTADIFPKAGVLCTMPIPEGASEKDDFYVLHLFGEDSNGHKAGNAEMPAVTKDGTNLSFTIKGMSPLLLVWTGEAEPEPEPSEEIIIKLDANGGKVSRTEMKANTDGTVPALPTPQERDGYIFGGWYDAQDGGLEVFEGDVLTESVTLYAHWFEVRVTVTENAVVPETLKEKYATVDAMKTAMLNTVKRRLGTTTVKGSKLYELTVEYNDGSNWLPLPADLFPTKGVKVSLTIPNGAATTDRFVALHLFGEDCNGHKAGEGEMPTITKNDSTLSFTVKGMSPLLLVWTGSSSGGGGNTPKTGDESNLGLWIALMAASSAATAVLVIEQKKRKNKA
ncbi:MAG: InlB B-repeat-containing protein [Clostridia bacterium]